jgi:hypothetical protein
MSYFTPAQSLSHENYQGPEHPPTESIEFVEQGHQRHTPPSYSSPDPIQGSYVLSARLCSALSYYHSLGFPHFWTTKPIE